MSVMFSIHSVTAVNAHRHNYPGAPINIEVTVQSDATPHNVTLFCDDTVLVDRLVEAINKVARERREEVAAFERAIDEAIEEASNG